MNDIVDRLRGQEPLHLGDRSAAADVIERLRAELAECRAALMPFARIDLTTKEVPSDFAMLVLRARTALAAKGEGK